MLAWDSLRHSSRACLSSAVSLKIAYGKRATDVSRTAFIVKSEANIVISVRLCGCQAQERCRIARNTAKTHVRACHLAKEGRPSPSFDARMTTKSWRSATNLNLTGCAAFRVGHSRASDIARRMSSSGVAHIVNMFSYYS